MFAWNAAAIGDKVGQRRCPNAAKTLQTSDMHAAARLATVFTVDGEVQRVLRKNGAEKRFKRCGMNALNATCMNAA